jgi:protein tyrosine phosphatase
VAQVQANYTVRTLRLRHLKLGRGGKAGLVREVVQYQYTSWPDHGTPRDILPVLSFIKKSSGAWPESEGPLVVHCSAGVGRTGENVIHLHRIIKHLQEPTS